MCEAVVPKVVRSAKPLVTLEAGEGTLVCVGPLVDLQVVALGELPVAELANVSLARPFTLEVGRRGVGGNGGKEELMEVVGKGVEGARVEGQGEGGHGAGALVRVRLDSSTVAGRFITLLLRYYPTNQS